LQATIAIHNVLPNGTKAAVEKLQIIITSIKQRQNILWLFYRRWKSSFENYDEATDTVTITTYIITK
jgi:hypothetical protein